jgi:thiol-disulfide isomerase/thioredoxin
VSGEELVQHMRTTGNRATIVNAWASWCGPCRREMPMLIGLTTNLAAQGVQVLFVSVDEPDSEQAALAFLREQGGEPPAYVAERPLSAFKQAMNPRWKGMLPATFLFDAEGKLRYFWGGPVYENELLPIVDGFLAGKNIDGEATFGLAPGQDSRH